MMYMILKLGYLFCTSSYQCMSCVMFVTDLSKKTICVENCRVVLFVCLFVNFTPFFKFDVVRPDAFIGSSLVKGRWASGPCLCYRLSSGLLHISLLNNSIVNVAL